MPLQALLPQLRGWPLQARPPPQPALPATQPGLRQAAPHTAASACGCLPLRARQLWLAALRSRRHRGLYLPQLAQGSLVIHVLRQLAPLLQQLQQPQPTNHPSSPRLLQPQSRPLQLPQAEGRLRAGLWGTCQHQPALLLQLQVRPVQLPQFQLLSRRRRLLPVRRASWL